MKYLRKALGMLTSAAGGCLTWWMAEALMNDRKEEAAFFALIALVMWVCSLDLLFGFHD